MREKIMPNDVVKHKPTGETWVVAGVNHQTGELIPMGCPFPSIAKTDDCEILERRYETESQDEWTARGRAEVSHPRYGTLTVPCGSPYEALLNACEVWGVDCVDVMRERKYTVQAARKGAKVTVAREYILPVSKECVEWH